MIKVANESLRMAKNAPKLSTRIAKLKATKEKVAQLKQLINQYPFLSLPNLRTFENDIITIEKEIHRDQQLAVKQKKPRASAKTQHAGHKGILTNLQANQSRMAMFRANADVIDGIKWLAALDSRTCLACGALDGMIWQPNQLRQIKSPPLHKDCRCVLIPYIDIGEGGTRSAEAENFDQMAQEKYEANPKQTKSWSKLSEATRRKHRYAAIKAYKNSGKEPYKRLKSGTTFEQYLRGRSQEFQRLWFIQEGIYDQYWEQWINRRMTLAEIASAKASRR